MEIIAGMILMCTMITRFDHGSYNVFIKNVETKVHTITPTGSVLVQYNLKKHKALYYPGDEELFDIVDIRDMKNKKNMNRKRMENDNKKTKL